MGYSLGIDLGTTFTAAAVARDGRVEISPMGNHAATIPSLVFLREDEDILIGDAAERRGALEPTRLAREFKRRFGDSAPIMLERTPFSAERLMALVLRQIVAEVTQRQGAAPDVVALAHPANWGPYKIDLLRQAAQLAGIGGAMFITEPVAAAVHYASTERVDTGDIVAVYDLGGGTFDAAVLRKTLTGFDTLGQPEGIERLGGIDFDEAVYAHVRDALGDAVTNLDPNDPATRSAIARLRQECVAAKEALSSDTDATIPVFLPAMQTQVRITRAEFESMIRPTLRETVDSLRRAIASAGIEPEQVRTILLAGGSSRIPLVAQLVRTLIGRPVSTDAHPKHAVAMGAARFAAATAPAVATPLVAVPPPPPSPAAAAPPPPPAGSPPPLPSPQPAPPPAHTMPVTGPVAAASSGGPPTAATAFVTTTSSTPPGRGKRLWALVAAGVLVVGGVAAFVLTRGGDDSVSGAPDTATDNTENTSTPPTDAATSSTPTTEPSTSSSSPVSVVPTGAPTTAATTTTTVPITCGASGRCAGITGVRRDGDTIVVDYQVQGFDPSLAGATEDHHMHFFYDTVPFEKAGVPNSGPWIVWDRASGGGQLVFTGFTFSNINQYKGAGATAICVAIADHRHTIELDTASCMDLPFTLG